MLNIDRALGGDRLMKAMTGFSASEFNELTKSFEEEFQNDAQNRYEIGVKIGGRERKPGGGRIGNLESYAVKLFIGRSQKEILSCLAMKDGILDDSGQVDAFEDQDTLTAPLLSIRAKAHRF